MTGLEHAGTASTPRGADLDGLTEAEVAERLAHHGPNSLPPPPRPSLAGRVVRSLGDPLVLVLLASLLLTLLTGDVTDAIVIGVVITVNTTLAVHQEIRADNAVEALGNLVSPSARVVRAGEHRVVPAADIVPDDLVVIRQGDLVPADAILVEGTAVRVDESMLTGESVPVEKSTGTRADRLSSGTVIVHGRGLGRVTATGPNSALGQIATMVGTTTRATPLQRRMARLSAILAVATITLSLVVLAIGLLRGEELEVMVLTAIALIVAAVPESLPLVVTVSLALAARRMAVRRALVRNLAAVETLGSVTVLATDKTGTLTRAEMTVSTVWQPPDSTPGDLWRALSICSDAALDPDGETVYGDPTESALLREVLAAGWDVQATRAAYPRVAEVPFDSTTKRMVTVSSGPDGTHVLVCKGAPESLLVDSVVGGSHGSLTEARARAELMAADGTRVIAVADRVDADDREPRVAGLRLLGLVGLKDPLRDSSRDTVLRCRNAGMRVVLVTGDHPVTAGAIAAEAGISDDDDRRATATLGGDPTGGDIEQARDHRVISRATPADKLTLVQRWQETGEVVAMTGDGVNDAPALRRADIGVAMGQRGTEVARQAADLVLSDDHLGSVVAAVEEGRRVYANIRRFLLYGLAGGTSEIALMLLGPAVGLPLPLLPAQILWVNLLTHSFAGAGLATQETDPEAMTRPPRPPRQGVLGTGLWWRILVLALFLATASLAVALVVGEPSGRSASLLALGAGQLAVAWGVRTRGGQVFRRGRVVDPLLPALAGATLLLVASVLVPPLRELLSTYAVDAQVWGLVALTAAASYVLTRMLGPRTF